MCDVCSVGCDALLLSFLTIWIALPKINARNDTKTLLETLKFDGLEPSHSTLRPRKQPRSSNVVGARSRYQQPRCLTSFAFAGPPKFSAVVGWCGDSFTPNDSDKLRPAIRSHIDDDCHSTHCQIDSLRYQFDFAAAFAIRNPTAKQTHRK